MFRHYRIQRRSTSRLLLERLENRTVPTTTAMLSSNVLTITGDGNDTISVAEESAAGTYLVGASDLTGGTPQQFTRVNSIVVNAGNADNLNFYGNASLASRLNGTLTINSSSTLLASIENNINIGGRVTVNHSGTGSLDLTIGGAGTTIGGLTVFDVESNSNVRLNNTLRVLGSVSLNLGAGNNSATFANARIDSFVSMTGTTGDDFLFLTNGTSVGQNIFLDAGVSKNEFRIESSTVAGTLNYTTSGVDETFVLQASSFVQGSASVTKTAGIGTLTVAVQSSSRLGGDLRVRSNSSNDDIIMSGGSIIAGSLDVDLQGGINEINVNGGTINNLLHFASGTEVIKLLNGTRVRGFVSVNAPNSTSVNVELTDTAFQTFLSVVGGGGADTVTVANSTINANLAFNLGAGADTTRFSNTSIFGTTIFDGGIGAEVFDIERGTTSDATSTRFFGNFTFRGGSDGDRLNLGLDADDEAIFLAGVEVDGGGFTGTNLDIVDIAFVDFEGPQPSFKGVVLTPLTVYAVTNMNQLISFRPANPEFGSSIFGPILGLQDGETVVAIDVRPATGELFGLTSNDRIVTISISSNFGTFVFASPVGPTFAISGDIGFDFNPVPDALRIVSDADTSLRVTGGGTGAVTADANLNYAAGNTNATQNPNVVASAYSNNFAGATTTTLYGIDSGLDVLVRQEPPNNGTLTTIGNLGVNATDLAGFDITLGDAAYAVLNVGGVSRFYVINLTTGAAQLVGNVSAAPLVAMTILPPVV